MRPLPRFSLDDWEWDALMLPINLAFFFHSSAVGRIVAAYPGAGGIMESSLEIAGWDAVIERNPELRQMAPDVEALLVNRIARPPAYYLVPIDRCFHLAGLMRKHWRGLSGGDEVWREIDGFFAGLRRECEVDRA